VTPKPLSQSVSLLLGTKVRATARERGGSMPTAAISVGKEGFEFVYGDFAMRLAAARIRN